MKLYRVILIALFSSFCLSLNAQVFIGGGINFTNSTREHEDNNELVERESAFGIGFSPKVGVFLSEKLAIGIDLNLSTYKRKTGIDSEAIYKQSNIGVSPFVRYYALNWNKFSVFGQGNIGVEFIKSTTDFESTVTDGPKETKFYIYIAPGLSYNLSDKLSLETSLNFLSFGYNHRIHEDDIYKNKNSDFYFGAGLYNIVTIGAIKIGAIYKF